MEPLHRNDRPVPRGTVDEVLFALGVEPRSLDAGQPSLEQEARLVQLLAGATPVPNDAVLMEGLATVGWRRWLAEFLKAESEDDLEEYGDEINEQLRNSRMTIAIDLYGELHGDRIAGYAGFAALAKNKPLSGGPPVDGRRIAFAAWGGASGGETLLVGQFVSQYQSWLEAYRKIRTAVAETGLSGREVIESDYLLEKTLVKALEVSQ